MRKRREALGLSKTELAYILGKNEDWNGYLGRIEDGIAMPSWERGLAILTALGLDASDFQ